MFHFGKCFGNVVANVDTLVAQWLKLVSDKTEVLDLAGIPASRILCVEFARSRNLCASFLWVLWLPPTGKDI